MIAMAQLPVAAPDVVLTGDRAIDLLRVCPSEGLSYVTWRSLGMAAQLTAQNDPDRPLHRCTCWAKTSLPVPLSPKRITDMVLLAMRSRADAMAASCLPPTIPEGVA